MRINDPLELSQKQNIIYNNQSLRIITINIRSVNANFDAFIAYLTSLGLTNCDILVLTECWINESSIIPTIPNYLSFSTKKSINQNDGIIIWQRQFSSKI